MACVLVSHDSPIKCPMTHPSRMYDTHHAGTGTTLHKHPQTHVHTHTHTHRLTRAHTHTPTDSRAHTRVTRCWQCSTTHIKVDNELYTLVVHFGFFCSMTHAYIKVDNNGFCALCEMTPSSHRYDIYHAGKGTTLHTHAHPHARTHTHDSLLVFHYSCTANPAWSDIFECCFKAQSSKLERLFSLKRCTRGVGAFENVTQVGLAVYRGP